jgi:transposase
LEAEIEEVVDLASASWWYGYWQDRSIALESIAEIRASLPAAKSSLRTIGIHVRRGDFVNLGLSLPSGYYTRALADVTAEYPGISKVYVYSDDLTWCRSELRPDVETVYATSGSPAADMLSLSTHEYLILSRGTFGWWSSYLRERAAETVVVPDDYLPGDPVKQELLVDPGWRRTPVADPDRGDREHE